MKKNKHTPFLKLALKLGLSTSILLPTFLYAQNTVMNTTQSSPQASPQVNPPTLVSSSSPLVSPMLPSNLVTSTPAMKSVVPAVSNLRLISEEKRSLLEQVPIGKTIFYITEELLISSLRSESLISRVTTLIEEKEKNGVDVTFAKVKLDEAKIRLSTANTLLTKLSSTTEMFANEVSTSTYKKAVRAKRVEFKKNAEDIRSNIKATNKILREIVLSFMPKVSPEVENSNSGTSSSSSQPQNIVKNLLIPPPLVPPTPIATTTMATSTKKTLLLEQ